MPSLTTLFAQNLTRAAGYELTDTGAVLDDKKIVFQVEVEDGTLSEQDHSRLLRWLLDRCPDRTALAVRHAASLDIDQMGILGLACKSAPDLGSSLRRFERFFDLLSTAHTFHTTVSHEVARVEQIIHVPPNPAQVLSREAGLGAAANVMRTIAGRDLTFERVLFPHKAPANTSMLQEFFGCPLEFDADITALEFSATLLARPNRLGDPAVSAYFEAQLLKQTPNPPVETRLDDQISQLVGTELSEGIPKVLSIARQLGMSERTLNRRLSKLGLTYKMICDRTQRRLARDFLSRTDHPISEIAFLTGFSEPSAFNRAFKRWSGQTPSHFRQQARQD